ncbi:hypothetical protein [Acinetobacter courvalinii]|uniref:hypothetical protein n=1 Tax=Acinetobacter courvalinii TaxID=280147 RepID=UPI0028A02A93|nr:hypothetical protein [Acinetobacter courvalinii]
MTTKYDWSSVPYSVKFIATDKVGQKLISWGYHIKPRKTDSMWLCGDSRCNPILIGVGIFNGYWKDSLEQRPGEPQ